MPCDLCSATWSGNGRQRRTGGCLRPGQISAIGKPGRVPCSRLIGSASRARPPTGAQRRRRDRTPLLLRWMWQCGPSISWTSGRSPRVEGYHSLGRGKVAGRRLVPRCTFLNESWWRLSDKPDGASAQIRGQSTAVQTEKHSVCLGVVHPCLFQLREHALVVADHLLLAL